MDQLVCVPTNYVLQKSNDASYLGTILLSLCFKFSIEKCTKLGRFVYCQLLHWMFSNNSMLISSDTHKHVCMNDMCVKKLRQLGKMCQI